jgi:hypothetical protein
VELRGEKRELFITTTYGLVLIRIYFLMGKIRRYFVVWLNTDAFGRQVGTYGTVFTETDLQDNEFQSSKVTRARLFNIKEKYLNLRKFFKP